MKSVIILTAVAIVAAILFVACSKSKSESPSNPSPEKFVDVDEHNSSDTIHVLPGETIRIKLRSNPSTGFSWALGPIEDGIFDVESAFEAWGQRMHRPRAWPHTALILPNI